MKKLIVAFAIVLCCASFAWGWGSEFGGPGGGGNGLPLCTQNGYVPAWNTSTNSWNCVANGSGTQTWPSCSNGSIFVYNGASGFGTCYNSGNQIPFNFLNGAQPSSPNLTTLAGITPGAEGQSLLAAANAAAVKTLLGYYTSADVGVSIEAYSAILAGIAGATQSTGYLYWNGSAWAYQTPSGTAAWGGITGTLSSQTDLQNALNAKQGTLTLTTTGSSGAATLVGSTLNIPQYSGLSTVQTNGTNNTSQTALNFITSTVNTAGLTATPSNPATGSEKIEITGTLSAAAEPAHTGDCTNSPGSLALSCTETGGTAFGALATVSPGSGVAAAAANAVNGAGGFTTFGTDVPIVSGVATYQGGSDSAVSGSGSLTCTLGNGNTQTVAQTGSSAWTLTLSGGIAGQVYRIYVIQNSSGNAPTPTVAAASGSVVWIGSTAFSLTTTANKRNLVTCNYVNDTNISTTYFCSWDGGTGF